MTYDDQKVVWVKQCISMRKPDTFIVRELTKIIDNRLTKELQEIDDTHGDVTDRQYITAVKRASNIWNSVSTTLIGEGIKVIKFNAYRDHLLSKASTGGLIRKLGIFKKDEARKTRKTQ